MARYIDADLLFDQMYENEIDCGDYSCFGWQEDTVIGTINKCQTADVEPVVRCKDCFYYDQDGLECQGCGDEAEPCGYCHEIGRCVDDLFYCKGGKSMEQEGE